MENNIVKPVTIIREEFINELKKVIDNCSLPAFIIEPILRDAYNRVKIAEQKQLERDFQYYQQMIDNIGDNNVKDVEN